MKALDTCLLQTGTQLWISGRVQPVDNDPNLKEVESKGMGPVRQWWSGGFEPGEEAYVGVTTDYADYYLVSPAKTYVLC